MLNQFRMKQFRTTDLLQTLKEESLFLLEQIENITRDAPMELLEVNEGKGRWNTLQVLEHLNTYYRYYIPVLESRIGESTSFSERFFFPGWLGGYFTRTMMPKNGGVRNKMKAMKNHSPDPDLNGDEVIREFQQWQRKFILLISRAEQVNLNTIRIPLSIAPFITLKLGDILMFIVAHNQRHWIQIENLLGRFHEEILTEDKSLLKVVGSIPR
jgi:hypothetical protein